MARVIGNPFGDMRGKLGGMVFSRNKSGQIVRVYVKNTDKESESQVARRGRFAAVSSLWSSIPLANKANWNQYAEQYFSPKSGKKHGLYSGFSAFMSCESNKVNFQNQPVGFEFINPSLTSVAYLSAMEPVGKVPEKYLTAGIYDVTTKDYITFSGSECCFVDKDTVKVKVLLDRMSTANLHKFTNAEDNNPFSFVVYCSESLSYEGQKAGAPFRFVVAYAKFVEPKEGWSAVSSIEFDLELCPSWYKNINKPQTGDPCVLTLAIFDGLGQIVKVGQNWSVMS